MTDQYPGDPVVIKWVENLDDVNDPEKLAAAPTIDPAILAEAFVQDEQLTVRWPGGDITSGPFERIWITEPES